MSICYDDSGKEKTTPQVSPTTVVHLTSQGQTSQDQASIVGCDGGDRMGYVLLSPLG